MQRLGKYVIRLASYFFKKIRNVVIKSNGLYKQTYCYYNIMLNEFKVLHWDGELTCTQDLHIIFVYNFDLSSLSSERMTPDEVNTSLAKCDLMLKKK